MADKFVAVTEIRHSNGVTAPGTEVKRDDFSDEEWQALEDAGAVSKSDDPALLAEAPAKNQIGSELQQQVTNERLRNSAKLAADRADAEKAAAESDKKKAKVEFEAKVAEADDRAAQADEAKKSDASDVMKQVEADEEGARSSEVTEAERTGQSGSKTSTKK